VTEVSKLLEELIRAASVAEPKWVVEPKSYPYAVYDGPEVVGAVQKVVDGLGLKGVVARVVVKVSTYRPLMMHLKFYGRNGEEVLSGHVAHRKLEGGAYVLAPNDGDAKPVAWVSAISFIRSGIDRPKFEDMLHVLGESAWPAYRALYGRLLEGFCQRASAAVCSARAEPARVRLKV